MITLNNYKIGVNTFNVADELEPKYYYLKTIFEDSTNSNITNISTNSNLMRIELSSKDVDLKYSVSGTVEDIENQLKYFIWKHLYEYYYDSIKKSYSKIYLPGIGLHEDRCSAIKNDMFKILMGVNRKYIMDNFHGRYRINNITIHEDAYEFFDEFEFDLKLLKLNITINNNLPRHKMIFSYVSNDTITHENICIVYKNIKNVDKTFTTLFDIISSADKLDFICVDIPASYFRKYRINNILN
jgi:hypothetical protein